MQRYSPEMNAVTNDVLSSLRAVPASGHSITDARSYWMFANDETQAMDERGDSQTLEVSMAR